MNNLKNTPLVSVIISCFDSSKTLKDSIESILNQSYNNYEVLIMDDGSTDDTAEILKKINNSKIRLFTNKENLGLTKSLNQLITKSNGKYIARHDADDISLQTRLEEQVLILENTKYDVCTSRALRKDSNKNIPGMSYLFPYRFIFKFKNPFIHGTLMISKKLLMDQGVYDERFKYSQDYKLFSNLIKNKVPIYKMKKPLYILNMSDNISSKHLAEQTYFANCVKKNITPKDYLIF